VEESALTCFPIKEAKVNEKLATRPIPGEGKRGPASVHDMSAGGGYPAPIYVKRGKRGKGREVEKKLELTREPHK